MSGFFEELQRRKVYRCAAAYGRAAGFLIQHRLGGVSSMGIVPELEFATRDCAFINRFSDCSILAWHTTSRRKNPGHATTPGAHRRRNLIFASLPSLILLCLGWIFLIATSRSDKIDKFGRVPAFQNLKQAIRITLIFGEWHPGRKSDTLLNQIWIESDFAYFDQISKRIGHLAEIAKQLGVANILEGSVQKARRSRLGQKSSQLRLYSAKLQLGRRSRTLTTSNLRSPAFWTYL